MKIFQNFYFVLLLLVLTGALAYANSWHVPFQFDDEANILKWWITDITKVHHIWDFNVRTRFLPYLSFSLNYFFFRDNVFGYHVVNYFIHIANGLWVYLLTVFLIRTPKMNSIFSPQAGAGIALFAALIFVAHPLQTQAVTYIVQRISSMAAFFYLGACVAYLNYRLKGMARFYFISLAMTCAAMFCKENALTLPFMIMLIDWIFFGFSKHPKRKVVRDLLPLLACAGIVPFFFHFYSKARWGASMLDYQAKALPANEYFLTQLNVIRTYLRLFLVPIGQNIDHDFPVSRSFLNTHVLLSAALLGGMIAAGFALVKKHKLLSFSIFWLFVTLSVESSFIPLDDVIFEHRMYLPMAGCAIFVATALYLAKKNLKIYFGVAFLVISMLGFLTYSRNQVWQTDVSLWQDVVKKSPHKARGYYNLGLNYDTLGDIVKAEAFYKKALEIDPNFLLALINLGIIDAENKRYDAAIKELTHASRLAPRDATTFDNLAVAYFEKGDTQNALLNFQKSMEADRYYPGVYHHVGIILRDNGRLEDSIPYFEKAISLNPYFTAAIFQLAKTQILLKRPQDAKFWIAKLEELRQGDLIAELEKLSSKRG